MQNIPIKIIYPTVPNKKRISTEVHVPISQTSISHPTPSKHLYLSLYPTNMNDNPKILLAPRIIVTGAHISTSSKHNSYSNSLLNQYTSTPSSQQKSNSVVAYIQPNFIHQSDPVN